MRYGPFTALILFVIGAPLVHGGRQQSTARQNCEKFIFSNVRHVTESDDYVGTEITLEICRGTRSVTGEWREYEGYHPSVTALAGEINGTIRLSGRSPEGSVSLVCRVLHETLTGSLVWYIDKSRQHKDLNLKRVERPLRPPE